MKEALLKATVDELIAVLQPFAEAGNTLAEAKGSLSNTSDLSIRAFIDKIRKINAPLEKEDITTIAEQVATAVYSGRSAQVRKSEIVVLLEQRADLPSIIAGVDAAIAEAKTKNPKAIVNVRQHVLQMARARRKTPEAAVQDLISVMRQKLVKHTPTSAERVKSMLTRVRGEDIFQVKVGDASMLDADADRALTVLDNLLEGIRPESDPKVAELESAIASLQDTVNELMDENLRLKVATGAELNAPTDSEGYAENDGEEAVIDTAAAAVGTRDASIGESMLGMTLEEMLGDKNT